MKEYKPTQIEKKWREKWEKSKINETELDATDQPFYNLMMFPYPSAEGLHIGSVYTFSGVDTFGRFKSMTGKDVFEPIGLDGFGIHSENFAIKIGEHIRDVSKRTEKHFYEQMKATGNMYDWSRTVETYKPNYYKWTQWLFTELYKAGLAYRKKSKVNWCPSCKTVLSDEQVIDGLCERCGHEVDKRDMKQWFFKITDYAEKLNKNLDWIKWDNEVKVGQRNWIGRSEGAQVQFEVRGQKQDIKDELEVYTTRPDTLFGATFMVIAPEHPMIEKFKDSIQNIDDVQKYIDKAVNKSDLERTDLNKDKDGIKLDGVVAINPVNNEEIPVFVADYVLIGYGTGAIMAVPAHDERDFEFAQKYNLEVIPVYLPEGVNDMEESEDIKDAGFDDVVGDIKAGKKVYSSKRGKYINSEFLNGINNFSDAFEKIMTYLEEKGIGSKTKNFRLRDWTVSRQRYWGPPIPMVEKGESKSIKVFAIHGTNAEGNSNWFPWLKNKLKDMGVKMVAPDFPDTDSPDYETRMKYIKDNFDDFIDEDTVIIGHSSGAATAIHIAEEMRVKDLILVAPYLKMDDDDERLLMEDDFKKESVDALLKYINKKVDVEKVEENSTRVVAFFGTHDPYVDQSHIEYFKEFFSDPVVKVFKNKAHFSTFSKDGDKLEDILDFIDTENWMSVPESDLPVLLPDIPEFEDILPDGSGKGPLEKQEDFVDVSDEYGTGARRETDVSDPFVDSCWYFLRYPFTELGDKPFGYVKRAEKGKKTDIDQKLINTTKEVYKLLEEADTFPMINGSLLLFGLNGYPFKVTHDIDIAFNNKDQAERAQKILEEVGAEYVRTDEFKNIVLKYKGIEVDLGFTWPESYLGYKVKIFDQKMRIMDPRLLREYYIKNSDKNKQKIEIIDHWMNQRINKWFPVTYYIGGKEHTVLHLLYARFITMVLNDLGYVDFEEPFLNFYGHGLITKDGAKMSKSKGNVINPDEYFAKYGADPVRLYLRFLGPFDQGGDWRDTGMKGMKKFVGKVWDLIQKFALDDIDYSDQAAKINKLHQTVKGVGEDLEELKFNTSVAKLMELINWYKENEGSFDKDQVEDILEKLVLMLAPLTPHLAEELWEVINTKRDSSWKWSKENSVHAQSWPEYDESQILEDNVTIAVQINGKMRGTVDTSRGSSEDEVMELVKNNDKFSDYNIENSKRIIFVKDKIVNIIV